jgi:hypothetical protein
VSRRRAVRPVRYAVRAFAAIVALAVTTTIIALSFGLLAVRLVGLDAYVVQGGSTESMVPIGSLVVVAPISPDAIRAEDPVVAGDDSAAPVVGTAWVAIPTLGYAVTYVEAYSSPIVIGLVTWILSLIAVRALAPYFSSTRRRLPA